MLFNLKSIPLRLINDYCIIWKECINIATLLHEDIIYDYMFNL